MATEVSNQTNKRKIIEEEESDEEDLELILKAEKETKKLKSEENKTNAKLTPKTPTSAKQTKKSEIKVNDKTVGTPKSVQTKLPFKSIQPTITTPKSVEKIKADSPDIVCAKAESPKAEAKEVVQREDGEWLIEDYLLDPEWRLLLEEEFGKKYFIGINKIIKEGYKKNILRPPKELVFNAFNSTNLNKIKVVIIGQDPYHDDNQAHGLAFSVPIGIRVPPSLKNIYKELVTDIPDFKRDEKLGGCLQKWTERGVFLLNTFLTVEAHKAGSHSKIGWDTFTDKTIKVISEKNDGCVFLLWGAFAQKKEILINSKRHKIIKCAHPSPFSATKFFNSKCFSKANEYLESIGKDPIDWSLKD